MSLFPELAAPPAAAPANWIHAHCDGGARGNPGPAGFGAVITDHQGQILAELSEFLGNRTNNYAEYSGLLAVLAWALEHQHPRLKVVSDSELMVRQIQGRYKVNSPDLKPLWQLARDRIAQLQSFEIAHALRHKNKAADALANAAMDRGTAKPDRGTANPDRGTANPDRGTSKPVRTPESPAARPLTAPASASTTKSPTAKPTPAMLRGFIRGGTVHILGPASLPDGIFVKIIPE